MIRLAIAVLVALLPMQSPPAAVQELDFVAVGVRYAADADPARRAIDLDAIRRAHFNVVATSDFAQQTATLMRTEPRFSGAPLESVAVRSADIGRVPVEARTAPDNVRESAWTLLAKSARGVVFEDWAGLQQNTAALAEASAFAETITRNMALYAPLRPVEQTGARAIAITGGQDDVEARWLESSDALLLIAINHASEPRNVTLTFPREVPEAVWQNMLSGGSVNFVAGPTGPFYEHVFPPHDVLVLMIRKRWK
jgi:hypothetical protein